ncbi:hypothetical protein GCM10027180_36640 [Microbulbifer echini]
MIQLERTNGAVKIITSALIRVTAIGTVNTLPASGANHCLLPFDNAIALRDAL